MKITELIQELEKIKKVSGDVHVFTGEPNDGIYCYRHDFYDKDLVVIGLDLPIDWPKE